MSVAVPANVYEPMSWNKCSATGPSVDSTDRLSKPVAEAAISPSLSVEALSLSVDPASFDGVDSLVADVGVGVVG